MKDYRKEFKLLFWGLFVIIFALNLFSFKGLSTEVLFTLAGFILMMIASIRLKELSPKFNLLFITTIVGIVMAVAMGAYEVTLNALGIDFSSIFNTDTPEIITKVYYTTVYVEALLVMLTNLAQFFAIVLTVQGLHDFAAKYVPILEAESGKRSRQFIPWGIANIVLGVASAIILIPQFNIFNQFAAGNITKEELLFKTTPFSVVTILQLVVSIVFIIRVVQCVFTISKFTKLQFVEVNEPVNQEYVNNDNVIDVEATVKEETKTEDNWEDDFK